MAGTLTPPTPTQPTAYQVVRRGMTAADYFAMPEDDGVHYELIDGDLTMSPSPSYRHQDCTGNLFLILANHVNRRNLGVVRISPIDVKLSDDTVLQPDIAFFAKGHPDERGDRQHSTHPPTLVIEVLSPSSRTRDRRIKAEKYRASGVSHYWIVDPARNTIDAFDLVDGEYEPAGTTKEGASGPTFSAKPFADLAVSLNEVFPE